MKKDFKTDIYKELKGKGILTFAHWELTNRCNENCIHCLRDSRRVKELTFQEVKGILLQLKKEGCLNVTFSGGEAFLRKDFWDILRFARKEHFAVKILTNGTLINKRNIRLLKKVRPQMVQVSLYGATAKMHDSVTRLKGSFKKTMNAIRLLERYKIPFKIATMCLNKNFPEIFEMRRKGRKRRWTMNFDFFIFPAFTGGKAPLALRVTDEQARVAHKRRILRWVSDLKAKSRKLTPINLINYQPVITAAGEVFPNTLLRMKLGSLRKKPLHKIWHNSPRLKWLKNLSEKQFDCARCKYYTCCCKRPEMAYQEQGSLLQRPREICRLNSLVQKDKS